MDADNNPDLTGLSCKRIINVRHLGGLTKSLHKHSLEFVIHVPDEYDYRYQATTPRIRDEIIQAIKLAYLTKCKDYLNVFGVEKRYLGKYTKTSVSKRQGSCMPDSRYIISDELIPFNEGKQSIGPDSDPDKEVNILFDTDEYELIPNYIMKNSTSRYLITLIFIIIHIESRKRSQQITQNGPNSTSQA